MSPCRPSAPLRMRIRILRMCLDEPLTNAQIAGRLGRDPASVLHHVRIATDRRTDHPREKTSGDAGT